MAKNDIDPDAVARLKELCPPGGTVYGKVTHVARSGMSRRISLYVVNDGDIVCIDGLVDTALPNRVADRRLTGRDGLWISGCGMDMRFEMVYRLSTFLHRDGYSLTNRAM